MENINNYLEILHRSDKIEALPNGDIFTYGEEMWFKQRVDKFYDDLTMMPINEMLALPLSRSYPSSDVYSFGHLGFGERNNYHDKNRQFISIEFARLENIATVYYNIAHTQKEMIIQTIIDLLGYHGFNYIPFEILEYPYDGQNEAFKGLIWYQRSFIGY